MVSWSGNKRLQLRSILAAGSTCTRGSLWIVSANIRCARSWPLSSSHLSCKMPLVGSVFLPPPGLLLEMEQSPAFGGMNQSPAFGGMNQSPAFGGRENKMTEDMGTNSNLRVLCDLRNQFLADRLHRLRLDQFLFLRFHLLQAHAHSVFALFGQLVIVPLLVMQPCVQRIDVAIEH